MTAGTTFARSEKRREERDAITVAGTDFQFAHRLVEILSEGEKEPLLQPCESCAGGGYLGADAYSFGALYEVLARQARESFKAKDEGK